MTTVDVELTEALRRGRRALDGVAGCEIVQDFLWIDSQKVWALHLRLAPAGLPPDDLVPSCTDWFLTAEHDYPAGRIEFYPAKKGGITRTFWHQTLNEPGPEDVPWREGNICTETILRAFRRHGFDEELRSDRERLRWHVLRALAWIRAAVQRDLVRAGDRYELPVYPRVSGPVIGFAENPETYQVWTSAPRSGLVDLVRHPKHNKIVVARRFRMSGRTPPLDAGWGSEILHASEAEVGFWVRLNEAPVLRPWQPPATWDEFQDAARSAGVDLFSFLGRVPRTFRDGRSHILLLGFPIPRRFEEPPERMHWLAVRLPVLSRGKQTVNGFRGPHGGWQMRDRQVVFKSSPLEWLTTENWAEDEISTRGRFGAGLRGRAVLLIGAGALGSAVGELLVRGGVHRISIVDPDPLQAGNLVRHSLTMRDIGAPKAKALTEWLNLLSPHARVEHIGGWFCPDAESVREADLVIDCTAEDDLLPDLAALPMGKERSFVSLSLGFQARRLFAFKARGTSFPHHEMIEQLQPWLREERAYIKEDDLPWEGIGCWHPTLPARVDDVRLFAALAVKALERWMEGQGEPGLSVFERDEEGMIRRVQNG